MDYEGFQAQFEEMEGRLEQLTTERLTPARQQAEEQAARQQAMIRVNLVKQVITVMASGLLLMSTLTRHFLRNLEQVRLVAKKLGSGELSARNEAMGKDEVGDTPRFTLSCGVADTDVDGTFQRVLRAADAAAYQSKQGGRDRVTLWQVGMSVAPEGAEVAANFGIEEGEEAAEARG